MTLADPVDEGQVNLGMDDDVDVEGDFSQCRHSSYPVSSYLLMDHNRHGSQGFLLFSGDRLYKGMTGAMQKDR